MLPMGPRSLFVISLFAILAILSCRKERFITTADATLALSADTLRFDTVFTTTGSITGAIKIFNTNTDRLRIDRITLGGGANSAFRINADGIPGPEATGLEIAGNDSLYVFVTVSINPNAEALPFLVRDSIRISYNGNEQKVQLEAYGQNAHFIRNGVIGKDTTWTNDLPWVLIGPMQVDTGVTLTINKGTRVYCHADAPILVDGSLIVQGTKADSVVFRGDRLDEGYRDLPAAWPGIYFRGTSKANTFTHTMVRNAYQGIVTIGPPGTPTPKVDMQACVIDNAYDAGIVGYNSSIRAWNLSITNCGSNMLLIAGGDYEFRHCSVAAWSTLYATHKKPVLLASNWDSVNNQVIVNPMNALFENCIFWGDNGTVDNEVLFSKRGSVSWSVTLRNSLYKSKDDPADAVFTDCIRNQDPLFDSIDISHMVFDLHLDKKPSPALDKGLPGPVTTDLDDRPRGILPDIGCHERL